MVLHIDRNQFLTFTYTNYKGETSKRIVTPHFIYWGSNQWYKEPQWLMDGWDETKKALRTFALNNMKPVEDE